MLRESEIGDEQTQLDIDKIYIYTESSPGYPTLDRG